MLFKNCFKAALFGLLVLLGLNCQGTGRTTVWRPGQEPNPQQMPIIGQEPKSQRESIPHGFSSLEIQTEPRECQAFLDDEPIGITPLRRDYIMPGRHTIRLTLPGYQDYQTTLTLHDGKKKSITIKMKEIEYKKAEVN